MVKVKKEEVFSGIIRRNTPKTICCKCPYCGAIFLFHKDKIPFICTEGPCPNCNTEYNWNYHTISPIKYKFMRFWRMLDGEA